MSEFAKCVVEQAERVERLLLEAGGRNENVRELYDRQLRMIIDGIKSGRITAPSDALAGYWYYFSPGGPWDLWDVFRELVSGMSTLINLLGLTDEAEFNAYRQRHGID